MLPSVSLYSGQIHIRARNVFPCWNTTSLLAITNTAPLLAMGCLQPVCIVCASFIYLGETMNIKCLCWILTWCVKRQMSLQSRGRTGRRWQRELLSHRKLLSSVFPLAKSARKMSGERWEGGEEEGERWRQKKMKMKSVFLTVVSSEALLTDNC